MPFQFRKEAIEEDLNSNFPSQGQGNPPLYYSLSEVVVPTYSINSVAEGSGLPELLQTAWDFSTGNYQSTSSTRSTIISNAGFWLVDLTYSGLVQRDTGSRSTASVSIYDGITDKEVWASTNAVGGATKEEAFFSENKFVVFLRSGDSLRGRTQGADFSLDVWYRQIAEPNGTLVNPLGYSAA